VEFAPVLLQQDSHHHQDIVAFSDTALTQLLGPMRYFSPPSQEGSPSLTFGGHDCDLAEITSGFTHGGPLDISHSPNLMSSFQKDTFSVEMNIPPENILPVDNTKSAKSDGQRSLPEPVAANPSSNWSSRDDAVLLSSRSRGQGWSQIQRENFRNKTANACRKRHERLVAKRRGIEWNQEMLEKLSTEYSKIREDIWQPLARAVGEKWQDVEKAVRLILLCPISSIADS
jgi:Myb-like DNA-binding domain